MIYFDIDKKAYGYEIEDYLCKVEESEWSEYSMLTLGEEYDITENGIVDLRNTEEYKKKEIEERKKAFLQDFFEIPNVVNDKSGYYRKLPKGYSSAVESINSAFNMVTIIGQLPKDTLIFYEEPDFTKLEECTEEWLIEHQFKNETMTPTEFGKFYAAFLQAWNKQEHLEE